MQTIVEPKQHIDKLWGKQRIREDETYRLMKYVLRVDHDNNVIMHNVVTGHLVVLDEVEANAIAAMPHVYSPEIEALVGAGFLVPVDFDEHDQVSKIRTVLRKLNEKWESKTITKYTILPTTTCNARCYYCFEQGKKASTMTARIAYDVVDYIASNYVVGTKVVILWFGGEPTIAANRIDQITEGLIERKVCFSSRMMSNGYLLDRKMVQRAKQRWNLESVKICLDGDRDQYNAIKSYTYTDDNPYEKVMSNIGHLLDAGIGVGIRMNFDIENYDKFNSLLEDVKSRFGLHPMLEVSAHPIIGEYKGVKGQVAHGDDQWLEQKTLELNNAARRAGLYAMHARLPHLEYKGCSAARSSAVTITPDGQLVKCLEQFDYDQVIGNIYEGVVNRELVNSWKQFADYDRCVNCVMYPVCGKLVRCAVKDKCYYSLENIYQFSEAVKRFLLEKESA